MSDDQREFQTSSLSKCAEYWNYLSALRFMHADDIPLDTLRKQDFFRLAAREVDSIDIACVSETHRPLLLCHKIIHKLLSSESHVGVIAADRIHFMYFLSLMLALSTGRQDRVVLEEPWRVHQKKMFNLSLDYWDYEGIAACAPQFLGLANEFIEELRP